MALVYLLPSGSLATSLGGTDNGLFTLDSSTGIFSRAGTLTPSTVYNVAYLVYDTTTGLISGKRDTITAGANVLQLSGTPGPAYVNAAYTFTPTVQYASGAVTYSLSGTLPSGLSFSTSTGAISGTPTATASFSGSITGTDTGSNTSTLSISLTVNPAGATWTKQRAVTLTNGPTAATNYQQFIALTSANFDFASAAADGSDIRVLASDGTTALSYWLETFDPTGQTARLWVKVPSIAASGTYTAYLVYGCSQAQPTTANGNNVFLFFDDFAGTVGWNRYKVTNPLIQTASSSWKSNIVGDPSVIPPDSVTNEWGAFYNGATGTTGDIGYMRSADGKTWTDGTTNPVFTHTTAGMDYAIKPSVIFWSATSTYYMAYTGQLGAGNVHIRMAKATSRTGPWTDLGAVLTPNGGATEGTRLDCPSLVIDSGNTIRLYYSANQVVANEPKNWCVAISTTGPEGTYTRYSGNPIASPNGTGTKFNTALGGMSWRKLSNGTWDCAFNGFTNDANQTSYMGRFNCADGLTIPAITDAMLLFDLGPPGAWDRVKLYRPCIYTTSDGVDRLLYNALGDTEQIGYAELTRVPYDLSKWTPRLQGQPTLEAASGVLALAERASSNPGSYFALKSNYNPPDDVVIDVRLRIDTIYDAAQSEFAPFMLADADPLFGATGNAQWIFVSKFWGNTRRQSKSGGNYGTEQVLYNAYPTLGTWQRYRGVKRSTSMDFSVMSDTGTVLGSISGDTSPPNALSYPLYIGGHGAQGSYDNILVRQYLANEPTASVGGVTTVSKTGL